MNKKLYFSELSEEMAYNIEYILAEMKENKLKELIVFEAERETGTDYFYCKAVDEVCIKDKNDTVCGAFCPEYIARNGKSGCCLYRGYCYVPGTKYLLSENGKLNKTNNN